MPAWSDFFKLFTYASEKDPLSALKNPANFSSAGVSQPEAIGTDFQSGGGSGSSSFRQTNDMIDTTTLSNRTMRYKEYERLRNVPEIEMAMTVFADEACVAGDTKVATPFGFFTIKELTEKKGDERFLVYCYDFKKKDFNLSWAYAPRLVKKAPTITIILDNGSKFTATHDHRVLLKNGTWIETGDLKFHDELMPFYRLNAQTNLKHKQYPRLFSFDKGWINERQFIDDWKSGKTATNFQKVNKVIRMIGGGLTTRQIAKNLEFDWSSIEGWIEKEGFTSKETRRLYRNETLRKVVGIEEGPEQDVYDISVENHQCFATDSVILHNCQKDEDGNIFKVLSKNDEVKQEVEFVLQHKKMLDLNTIGWTWFKNLIISGDGFIELVINSENPKEGIYLARSLPPETMYRIETVKGKLIEFQQSKEGPDYQAIVKGPAEDLSETELNQTNVVRFAPYQIIHFRIGDDRKTFYPYGQSLIEPARGPAHSLRLMEDAMVVYRLCVIGTTRVRTNNGWKYMKDMKIGDLVYSCNEYGKLFSTDIIWTVNNGVKDVFQVKSQHNEITGTDTHPILINRDGVILYVDIKDLIPKKDKLINATRDEEIQVLIPRIIEQKWAKLSNNQRKLFLETDFKNKTEIMRKTGIKVERVKQFLYTENKSLPYEKAICICNNFNININDLVIHNKQEKKPELVNLPEYVDEDFARLFGFLIGDGSIRSKGIGAFNQLNFSSSPDDELNNKYANLLKKYFGKINFERDLRSSLGLGKYTVNSKFACLLFLKMGYIPGAKNKRIPNWVQTASKSIRRAFIEGISDADGCERYTKKGLWFSTIELCNKKLIEDIKEVWHSIGLCSGKIGHRKRIGGHEIEPGRFMISTESYKVTITDRELPKYENIWSVNHVGQEEVYDVTVNNNYHNIVSNGIIVHQTRAPERRVFYIDVGQLPPFKAEAFIDRLKDQFRKRKTTNGNGIGANQVEEKWQPPAQDEDYWLGIRPNSNTRIDTLPGAENLGEIDDAVYFRNKLLTSLNFPKNYFNNEDPGATRITLSVQDVKFARMIERLQGHFENGILELAERHLQLRGFPEDSYKDLKIKMTPPSDWRELSRSEVVTARYANAGTLKSSLLYADYDILTKIMKHTDSEVEEMLARLKLQKLEDLKLQVLAQNPQLLGIGIPGADQDAGQGELGTEPGGPNMMPDPMAGQQPPADPMAAGQQPPPPMGNTVSGSDNPPDPNNTKAPEANLPEPEKEDIKKYDLEIQDYEAEQDYEDIDYSVGD